LMMKPGRDGHVGTGGKSPAPTGCPGGLIYGVRPSERLVSIARKFQVLTTDIMLSNPTVKFRSLKEGNLLCIPGAGQDLQAGEELVTVGPGETAENLAWRYSMEVDLLYRANPQLPYGSELVCGEQLIVPLSQAREEDAQQPALSGADHRSCAEAETADVVDASAHRQTGISVQEVSLFMACPDGLFYAARRGESCSSIARKFGVSVSDLERANPGIDCHALEIGQVLCVPGIQMEVCPSGRLYTVRRGDSMFTIAQRFGIPLSRLIAANPQVPDPDLI